MNSVDILSICSKYLTQSNLTKALLGTICWFACNLAKSKRFHVMCDHTMNLLFIFQTGLFTEDMSI